MPVYDNNMRGVLFRNEVKRDANFPDYSGTAEIDRKVYYVDGWINTTKDGKRKFLSLRYKLKLANITKSPASAQVAPDDFDDDIPF